MPVRPRLTPAMADARRAVRELLEELDLEPGSLFLVACSGGPDSMALAAASAFEIPKAGHRVGAVIIDHGLQVNSQVVAQEAAQRCSALGLDPVIVEQVNVSPSGEGLEAAARDARYTALEKARAEHSASFVLLGHNQDDQAETVLLGLARGSGLRSISGMPQIDQERSLVRPLLDISRAELRQSCLDQDLEFWDDPHNQDESFLRVRVRKLAGELGAGFQAALARTAGLAFEADDFLAQQAQAVLADSAGDSGLDVAGVEGLHPGLRRKALQLYLQSISGATISRAQVLEVEQLVINWHGQKKLDLSGITVERVNDRLLVTAN
ncbi:MAG: tRNA lysidine(34) synthetase TilS [Actinobacteria bacterium]|nr:tRNA lysidine(34) synthetase TilS [Actinomycetota bacterium]